MAPQPSITTLPHANAQPGNIYNVPRAPEVYTLAENVDAAIPKEVRDQLQCDENGRILFFTAPPLKRPDNGVAESYAGLGHSVSHLASVKQIREERRRKRKERDEALAREQDSNKRRSPSEEADRKEEKQAQAQAAFVEQVLRNWAAGLNKGTELLETDLGADWEKMMQQSREENQGKSEAEIWEKNLRWFYEDLAKRGEITAEKQKQWDEFLQQKVVKN